MLDADDAWLPERLVRMLAAGADADVVPDDLYRVEASEEKVTWSYLRLRWRPALVLDRPLCVDAHAFLRHDLGTLQPIVRSAFMRKHTIR